MNNEAKTISDQYQRKRNAEVCKQLTLKYGYHMAKEKAQVNRFRLTGVDIEGPIKLFPVIIFATISQNIYLSDL